MRRSTCRRARLNLDGQSWSIVANDQLFKAPEYRDIVVTWRNGAPVLLRDVAEVTDGVINARLAGWYNNATGRGDPRLSSSRMPTSSRRSTR